MTLFGILAGDIFGLFARDIIWAICNKHCFVIFAGDIILAICRRHYWWYLQRYYLGYLQETLFMIFAEILFWLFAGDIRDAGGLAVASNGSVELYCASHSQVILHPTVRWWGKTQGQHLGMFVNESLKYFCGSGYWDANTIANFEPWFMWSSSMNCKILLLEWLLVNQHICGFWFRIMLFDYTMNWFIH